MIEIDLLENLWLDLLSLLHKETKRFLKRISKALSYTQCRKAAFKKWKMKVNESTLLLLAEELLLPPPAFGVVRYLGMFLDKRLTWNPYTPLIRRWEMNNHYRHHI